MIKMVMLDRVKYGTKSCGERVRQQRDREQERERDSALLKTSDAVGKNLIVRVYIYDRCKRIIRVNEDDC
jgi:hypothetical protein